MNSRIKKSININNSSRHLSVIQLVNTFENEDLDYKPNLMRQNFFDYYKFAI